MPTIELESTFPPSLLDALKKEGRSLSCPWLGLAIGYLTPISFTMGHSFVSLEDSRWCEPTIVWPLMHMSSGMCKTNISKEVSSYFNNINDIDECLPDQITFEKLGMMMSGNHNKCIWYFDEFRSFITQLGVYGANGKAQMNESTILRMYDAGRWSHNTVQSANFNLPFTRMVLGGLSQTSHVMSLLNTDENVFSGFMPRFLIVMLNPIFMELDDLDKGDMEHHTKMISILKKIQRDHIDAKELQQQNYISKRSSLAYETFKSFYSHVTNWLKNNHIKEEAQFPCIILAKAKGQVLRLSAIFHAFFIKYDYDAVKSKENNGDIETFEISKMAMDAAIQLSLYSINQLMILKNFQNLNYHTPVCLARNNVESTSRDTLLISAELPLTSADTPLTSADIHSHSANTPSTSTVSLADTPISSNIHRNALRIDIPSNLFNQSPINDIMLKKFFHATQDGKVIFKIIIKSKVLGRKCSNKENILVICEMIKEFGIINNGKEFIFFPKLTLENDPHFSDFLTDHGIFPMRFFNCLPDDGNSDAIDDSCILEDNFALNNCIVEDNYNDSRDDFT